VINITKQRQWLYLLTALMLLMQSFAFWHDASHPFHIANEQCAPFHAVSHTPSLDLVSSALPFYFQQLVAIEPEFNTVLISVLAVENHPIRAPPQYS